MRKLCFYLLLGFCLTTLAGCSGDASSNPPAPGGGPSDQTSTTTRQPAKREDDEDFGDHSITRW